MGKKVSKKERKLDRQTDDVEPRSIARGIDLPGQSPRSHLEDSTLGPRSFSLQVSPPYSGAGLLHARVRFLTPGPQEAEQVPHLDQVE